MPPQRGGARVNLDIVGMLYCSDTLWRVQAQIV